MSCGLIRFAGASHCDVGKLCNTIYINLFSRSNEALESELNYYVLEGRLRGRGPSFCNHSSDVLVIDLYPWLILTPLSSQRQ